MQYIAHVCGKGGEVQQIKDMLLKCNPVLEAFGNAKTTRNDNSSRFGKYMDMQFDFKGDPLGGVSVDCSGMAHLRKLTHPPTCQVITEYLLEKSRVAHQSTNERNFHVFYQLLRGAEAPLLARLKLSDNPKDYNYLNQSGCDTIDTMDDVFGWEETVEALNVVQFSDHEKDQVWQLLAVILHMSNLTFGDTVGVGGQKGSKLTSDPSAVCALLGADEADLEETLTVKRVNTSRESVATAVSKETAESAARGMSKALYSRLFSWVVKRVNQSIQVSSSKTRKSIGVLDIYGFEIFGTNSFEQFIINYCNEKLQQIFIELTLKMEQAEYVREGIPWREIQYFDNRIICELIESRNGILALLDDYCMRPVCFFSLARGRNKAISNTAYLSKGQ